MSMCRNVCLYLQEVISEYIMLECPICKLKISSKAANLRRHMACRNEMVWKYECCACNQEYSTKFNFSIHCERKLPDQQIYCNRVLKPSRASRSNELINYGVQSSSIIRTAGPAMLTPATEITTMSLASEQSLDLSKWCNHRVLARQQIIYVAGIIRSVDSLNTILVEFDWPKGTQQSYCDVLGTGRFNIISDANPSVGDISLGTRVVCSLQANHQGHIYFIEGVITQILNDTKQFVVRTIANNDLTAERAQIRLLQPPWWNELNNIKNSGYDTPKSIPSLQMYHLLPTMQVQFNAFNDIFFRFHSIHVCFLCF